MLCNTKTFVLVALFFFNAMFYSRFLSGQSVTNFDNKILLTKGYTFYGLVHTEGWGFGYRHSDNQTYYKKRILEAEFVSMKHPKEIKTINSYFSGSKSYTYGKMNHLYIIRTGIGSQKILNEKPYWGGVQIKFHHVYGLAFGLAVPVYLYIIDYSTISGEYTVNEARYEPDQHFQNNIYGQGRWVSGLKEMSVYPGIYIKTGLSFEYGIEDRIVKALEVGTIVDAYYKKISMMAFNNDKQFFISFYLSFHFGRRKN